MLRTYFMALVVSSLAYSDDRQSLNFGLSFHTDASRESHAFDGKKNSTIDSAKPHIGYVIMDNVNIGVSGIFERQSSSESYVTGSGTRIERQGNTTLQGTQVFARFLFADYMFFEGGFGIYHQNKSMETIERSGQAQGSFEENTTSSQSIGYGHHMGAGLEIPVTNGFFATTSYIVRSIHLRDNQNDGSVGADKNQLQKREVSFGLSHYLQ